MDKPDTVSLLELVRVGWPIVVAIAGMIWWSAILFVTQRHDREHNRNERKQLEQQIASVQTAFTNFRSVDYKEDRNALHDAIERLDISQRASEKKLEDKLDRMSTATDSKLDKLATAQEQANLLLAEIRGGQNALKSTRV